jgi:hypothetical protein
VGAEHSWRVDLGVVSGLLNLIPFLMVLATLVPVAGASIQAAPVSTLLIIRLR